MKATKEAQQANQRASYLEHTLKMMQDQLTMMMEQQRAFASIGTNSVHPKLKNVMTNHFLKVHSKM